MQKTEYEVRISDWSSDGCSSDLLAMLADQAGLSVEEQSGAIECPTVTLETADHDEQAGFPDRLGQNGEFRTIKVDGAFMITPERVATSGLEHSHRCSARSSFGIATETELRERSKPGTGKRK